MRRTSSVCLVSVTRAPIGRVGVPGQQRLDLRRGDVVAALAVAEDAELVLDLLRAVDRDGHADALVGEEVDDVGLQQRGVGGQAEVDQLALLGGGAPRVADGALEHLEVHQRLAAEEGDVRGLADAGFLQREIDRRLRRLLAHELRLAAVLGVDDLVLAVLVAVLARQVALVGDVDHQRLDRHRRQRDDLRRRRPDQLILDGPDPVQLGQGVAQFGRAEAIAEHGQQLDRGLRPLAQQVDHCRRAVVEREHRRARHHVGEALARGLERNGTRRRRALRDVACSWCDRGIELDVERRRDQQVRPGLERRRGPGRRVAGHHPDVADVVALALALRVGAVDVRREEAGRRRRCRRRT